MEDVGKTTQIIAVEDEAFSVPFKKSTQKQRFENSKKLGSAMENEKKSPDLAHLCNSDSANHAQF